jgi:hypothetical protein
MPAADIDPGAEAQRQYGKEIRETIASVQAVIRGVWAPETDACPDDIHCYDLAVLIYTLKHRRHAQWQKKAEGRDAATFNKRARITPLESAAKNFQTELAKRRAELTATIPPEIAGYFTEPALIESTQQAVTALLESYRLPAFNAADGIRNRLVQAWRVAGISVKQGLKPTDRLCIAVTQLLALAGIHHEPSYVSDMLRGRWQRPRSGGPGGGRRIPEKLPCD